jgi:hypothetical protein
MTKLDAVFENKSAPEAKIKQMKNVIPILKPAYNFVEYLTSYIA